MEGFARLRLSAELGFCVVGFLLLFPKAGEARFGLALAFSRRGARARCRSWCGRVAGDSVSSGGGVAAASTAALLLSVFTLALQVFVVRIHKTACALLL